MDTQLYGNAGWAPPSGIRFARNRNFRGNDEQQIAPMQSGMTYQPSNQEMAARQQAWNQNAVAQNTALMQTQLQQQPMVDPRQAALDRYKMAAVPTTQDDAISLQRAGQIRLAGQVKPTGGLMDTPWQQTDPSSVLTPFELQQARSEGYTPQAYLMKRRLANLQVTKDASGNAVDWANKTAQQSGYAPEDLYSKPQFQTLAQQRPQDAQHIFQALTGRKLGEYEQIRSATREQKIKQTDERTKYQVGRARQLVEEDRIRPDPEQPGKFQYREWTQDVTGAKKLGDWMPVEGNAFASETAQHLDQTWVKNAELASLQKRKAEYEAAATAQMQKHRQGMSPEERLQYKNVRDKEPYKAGFTGLPAAFAAETLGIAPVTPWGQAPVHARSSVQNMEGFRELMARDPVKAQRIIAAIRAGQQVNQNAAMTANSAQDVYSQEAALRGY